MMASHEALGAFIDHGQFMKGSNRNNCREICRLAVQTDRHDRLISRGDSSLKLAGVQVLGGWIDLDVHRNYPQKGNGLDSSDERGGYGKYLVASLQPQGRQGDQQGTRAACYRDAVIHSNISRETLFELANLWAKNILTMSKNSGHPTINNLTQCAATGQCLLPLSLKINEMNCITVAAPGYS
jgi:hypothetical protein